jgi:hypothetical protein
VRSGHTKLYWRVSTSELLRTCSEPESGHVRRIGTVISTSACLPAAADLPNSEGLAYSVGDTTGQLIVRLGPGPLMALTAFVLIGGSGADSGRRG